MLSGSYFLGEPLVPVPTFFLFKKTSSLVEEFCKKIVGTSSLVPDPVFKFQNSWLLVTSGETALTLEILAGLNSALVEGSGFFSVLARFVCF